MEIRDGFDAFVIVEYIVLLVRRMDIIVIQSEAQQYGFQAQHAFKQCYNRDTTTTACRNRVFTKGSFDSPGCRLVSRGIGRRYHWLAAMVRGNLNGNTFGCDLFEMIGKQVGNLFGDLVGHQAHRDFGIGFRRQYGFGAFAGHLFPVWLGFKGGKGVATYLGVLIGLNGWIALAFAAIWLAVAWLSRYSSLSALTASVLAPLLLWFAVGMHQAAAVMAVLTLLLWIMHRTNISRLLAGNEGRIGQKG